MWLVTKIKNPTPQNINLILDLSLEISPYISLHEDILLYSLWGMNRYWDLHALPEVAQAKHKLVERLDKFHKRFGLNFALCPSAPWAFFLAKKELSKQPFQYFSRAHALSVIGSCPVTDGQHLLNDLLENSSDEGAFNFLCEVFSDLGLKKIEDLYRFSQNKQHQDAFIYRFGNLSLEFLKRLQGEDNFKIKYYEPSPFLEEKFYPDFEEVEPLEKIRNIFNLWEERLYTRKSTIRSVRIEILTDRKKQLVPLVVELPRPTRNAQSLFKITQEKWMSLNDSDSFFEDEIETVFLKSSVLESESDRQLDLFDPKREEREEAWNVLIGKILAKRSPKSSIKIGTYKAHASFFPENSIEWVDLAKAEIPEQLPIVEDHPLRPESLLTAPVALEPPREKIRSEEDFLKFLESHNAIDTLERLRDPWNPKLPRERSYARVKDEWVFWDHVENKLFVHGYFE